jgi:hypothetical protein
MWCFKGGGGRGGEGEGRGRTFLPITPRQAMDGIAILLCGFDVATTHRSEMMDGSTGGGGMRQYER